MQDHLLEQLLHDLFNESELRVYFGQLGLTDCLPGNLATFDLLCHEAASALERRGKVTVDLLANLMNRAGQDSERQRSVAILGDRLGVIRSVIEEAARGARRQSYKSGPEMHLDPVKSVTVYGGAVQIGNYNQMVLSSDKVGTSSDK